MKYKDLIKFANFGDTTAFVYDSPKNRYQYSSGEISDDVFQNVTSETEITLSPIQDFPEVQEVIADNFLAELKPAEGVNDGGYNYVKKAMETALLASWQEESSYGCETITTTVYMLILGHIDAIEKLALNSADEWTANVEHTYDVMFNDETKSDTMGFKSSLQYCRDFIDLNNGNPNVPYFGDYKGGIVQIINNDTKSVVFTADVL